MISGANVEATIEVANANAPLPQEAIEAVAAFLLDVADQEHQAKKASGAAARSKTDRSRNG